MMLKQQHRDLDMAVAALEAEAMRDELQIRRLKKQKLYLRDCISGIEDQINPDMPA